MDGDTDYKLYNADKMSQAYYSGIIGKNLAHTPVTGDPDGELKTGGVLQSIMGNQQGKVSYSLHARNIGWLTWVADGGFAGSTGQNRRIEAIKINPLSQMDVTAHIKDVGEKVHKNINSNMIIGTAGEKKWIEAIKIDPCGPEITAKAHIQGKGWVDYDKIAKDTIIGTAGQAKRKALKAQYGLNDLLELRENYF